MVWAFFPGNEMKSPKLFIVGRMEVLFGGLKWAQLTRSDFQPELLSNGHIEVEHVYDSYDSDWGRTRQFPSSMNHRPIRR